MMRWIYDRRLDIFSLEFCAIPVALPVVAYAGNAYGQTGTIRVRELRVFGLRLGYWGVG